VNIFQRAAAGLNLTPGERAVLKLAQGFALSGVVAVVLAAPAYISYQDGQPTLAAGALSIVLGSFIHAFLAAWGKYTSAKGDAPLATAIGAADVAIQDIIARYGGMPNSSGGKPGPDAAPTPVMPAALPVGDPTAPAS